jgi:hypothetical protein
LTVKAVESRHERRQGRQKLAPLHTTTGLRRWVVLVGISSAPKRGVSQRKWVLPAVTGAFVDSLRGDQLQRKMTGACV